MKLSNDTKKGMKEMKVNGSNHQTTIEEQINTWTLNVVSLLHAQRSSRHKKCRIGGLMFDSHLLEIKLQTIFYLGYRNVGMV